MFTSVRLGLGVALACQTLACGSLHKESKGSHETTRWARTASGERFHPDPPLKDPKAPPVLKPGLRYLISVEGQLQSLWSDQLETWRTTRRPTDPLNDYSLETTVAMTLTEDGELEDLSILSPSGNKDYDHQAEATVIASSPFMPPPQFRLSDDRRVHLSWTFARDRRQAGVASAYFRSIDLPFASAIIELAKAGKTARAAYRLAHERGVQADRVGLLQLISVISLEQSAMGDDEEIATAAIQTLATTKSARSVKTLESVAESSAPGRFAAMEALGALSDSSAVPLLERQLRAADDVREVEALASALVALDSQSMVERFAREGLHGDEPRRKLLALVAFSLTPSIEFEEEINSLFKSSSDREVRSAAALAMGPLSLKSPSSKKLLADCVQDKDEPVRNACLESIEKAARRGHPLPSLYPFVLATIQGAQPDTRVIAIRAAFLLDSERSMAKIPALIQSQDHESLMALVDALSKQPAPRASELLVKFSKDGSPDLRARAIRGLAGRDSAEARRAIFAGLEDSEVSVRIEAIAASDDKEVLRARLADPSVDIKAVALSRWIELSSPEDYLVEFSQYMADAKNTAERSYWASLWLRSTTHAPRQ